MRNTLVIIGFALFATFNLAQGQAVRKYSNEFLQIGVGARALGMGNSSVATANDATAGYWNPSALMYAPNSPEIAGMHAAYFANIANYDYVGFTMPIGGDRRFGASVIRLGIDDIANTLNLVDASGTIQWDNVETFSVADLAVLVSLAQRLPKVPGLNLGANLKVINRNVGKFANAWGFGLDLGASYELDELRLGLMISDVTGTFNAWTFNTETFDDAFLETGNLIPENSLEITLPGATFGAAYQFFPEKKIKLLATVDTELNFDGKRNVIANVGSMSIDPRAGVELSYRDFAFLRGGFANLQKEPNAKGEEVYTVFPTIGAGFRIKTLSIDYALTNVGNFSQTLYSHVFSLKYNFAKVR